MSQKSETVDDLIYTHENIAKIAKKEGRVLVNRYHHGYLEGLKKAKEIMESE